MIKTMEAEVRSWQDLVNLEQKYSLNSERKEWIYRGQPLRKHRLRPSLERAFKDLGVTDGKARIEENILSDFQRSCHVHAPEAVPDRDDIMAWFALMRHYGAPTRIVDFTYSLFIATYFAIESSKAGPVKGEEMPVIWGINRTWLTDYLKNRIFASAAEETQKALRKSWYDPYDHKMFNRLFMGWKTGDPLIDGWEPPGKGFVAVLSSFKTNDRILVQHGLFLAATRVTEPFHDQLEKMHDNYSDNVVQIHVTAGAHEILPRLYRAGVNSALLFPGLQGFAGSLRTKILTYREVDKVRDHDQNWRAR